MMADRGSRGRSGVKLSATMDAGDDTASESLTQWMAEISDAGMSDAVDNLLTGLVSNLISYEVIGEPSSLF